MKFSEMTYTRPDIDALLGQCKALAAKAAGAASGEELVNVYYEQSRAFADYSTAAQLASIHYCPSSSHVHVKVKFTYCFQEINDLIRVFESNVHCAHSFHLFLP